MDDSVLEQNQRPRQRRRTSTKHRRRKRKRTSNASADGGGRRGGGGSCFTSDGKRACDDSAWRNGNIDHRDYFVDDDDEVAEAALGFRYERYHRTARVVSDPEDLLGIFKRPLPVCFRFPQGPLVAEAAGGGRAIRPSLRRCHVAPEQIEGTSRAR